MKTTVSTIQKLIKISFVALILFGLQSCETEIPPEDPTPPEFSFQITGEGVNYTFNQNTDFDNIKLNLKKDASYDFTFTGSDSGGVAHIQWSILPGGYTNVVSSVPSPWVRTYANDNEHFRWSGDRSNPLTGSILSGRLTAPYDRFRVVFRFVVTDFGGESRRPNTITKELNISTGNVAHIGVIPI